MVGKFLGVYAIIPATGLLTVAFFVMVVLRKLEEGALKSFGRIITAFLCIAALLIFVMGMYVTATGSCPLLRMIGKAGTEKGAYYHISPRHMMRR